MGRDMTEDELQRMPYQLPMPSEAAAEILEKPCG